VNGDIHCHGSVVLFGQSNGELFAYPEGDFRIAEGVIFGSKIKRFVTPVGTGGSFSTVVGKPIQ
jgi:hypothetical protein